MNPSQQPDDLDLLVQSVLHEVANPAAPPELTTRTSKRIFAMSTTAVAPSNLLSFQTLDRTTGRGMSRTSVTLATLFNFAALLLLMVQVRTAHILNPPAKLVLSLDAPPPPLKLPPATRLAGGGGGHPDQLPVAKGNPPKFDKEQLNPPKAPPLIQPKIAVPATVDVDQNVHMAHVDMPNMGMPNAPTVGTGSLGSGRGTGIGSGDGAGIGPGSGHGMGGGVYRPGGGISAPVVLYSPEPQFSEEARKAKVAGNVLVYLQVDPEGKPTHVRVLRGIGMGLDEKALEAVRQYKFKPALKNGEPVTVEMNVEVNFQIF